MYQVSFHFSGTKRRREMAVIPRVGEFVCLNDGDDSLRLIVNSVYYGDDSKRAGGWAYWMNCSLVA